MGQGTLELFDGELPPVLETFQGIIQLVVEDYKQAVPIDKNHPFLISQPSKIKIQCWATIIKSGGGRHALSSNGLVKWCVLSSPA